jgi:hypothetical protein
MNAESCLDAERSASDFVSATDLFPYLARIQDDEAVPQGCIISYCQECLF